MRGTVTQTPQLLSLNWGTGQLIGLWELSFMRAQRQFWSSGDDRLHQHDRLGIKQPHAAGHADRADRSWRPLRAFERHRPHWPRMKRMICLPRRAPSTDEDPGSPRSVPPAADIRLYRAPSAARPMQRATPRAQSKSAERRTQARPGARSRLQTCVHDGQIPQPAAMPVDGGAGHSHGFSRCLARFEQLARPRVCSIALHDDGHLVRYCPSSRQCLRLRGRQKK